MLAPQRKVTLQAMPNDPLCTASAALPAQESDARAAWAAWDGQSAWGTFSQEHVDAPGVWTSHIVLGGMHCAACSITVEQALSQVDGVVRSQVNASTHRAQVVWDARRTKPSHWLQAIVRAGYVAEPVTQGQLLASRKKEERQMLWRWLVATLCMMQVMMYAWPSYVAEPGDITPDMISLMRWASWVLTLPVLLFSCSPFFKNAWRDVRHRTISMDFPVALGIAITFGVSTAVTFDASGTWGQEVYYDSLTMFVFFLLTGRWLELKVRHKTAGALDDVMQRLPQWVRVQQGDQWPLQALSRVQVGDTVQVRMGEAFPCDGRLLSESTLADEALLTGESYPVPKNRGDALLAGSFNQGATAQMQVTALGKHTRYAQILDLMQQAATQKPHMAALVDRFAPHFLWLVLLAAAVGAWVTWTGEPARAWMTAATVLIVTCPCALSLATPAAMLASAGAWARSGVLIRDLQTIERWAQIKRMVFDKTGTLTDSRLQVTRVQLASGVTDAQARAWAAALAVHSVHPASKALVASGEAALVFTQVHEVLGQGVQAVTADGSRWQLGSPAFCGSQTSSATSGPQVAIALNGQWLATFDLNETLRPDAAQALQQLQRDGVQSWLLSGDRPSAVDRIAAQLPLMGASAQNTPQDKLAFLKDMQARSSGAVAMVGDGLNDAPVLAAAHVSVAFAGAAPLNREKSDMVVMGDQLGVLAKTHRHAQKTMRVVQQNLLWALAYNLVCIPLAVTGHLPAWLAGLGMAASSLVVVANSARLARF
jgi:Cu2+-exporting ATPase